MKKKKRRRNTRKRRIIVLRIKIITFCLAVFAGIYFLFLQKPISRFLEKRKSVETVLETEEEKQTDAREKETKPEQSEETKEEAVTSKPDLDEKSIYTFMQGPKAWNSQTPWSGSWCEEVLAGSKFSVFGCGLCDMANIYSTLSPYECSPIDMFHYAKEVSDYSPGGGYGAIDWPFMEKTLSTAGFTSEIFNKDDTYEEFCDAIESAITAIVLVSHRNDDTYWTETEGHYVNIWSYNRETDQVFLADSGDPSHNRSWIPLRYVYDALKTSGEHQYMLVYSYDEEQNTWKHSGISEDWTIPEYYVSKTEP